MTDQAVRCTPVIVALPAQIDLTSCGRAYDQLYAAFSSGAPVVIADFTRTAFCDCSSLRRLVTVQRRAAARNGELRVVIPPAGVVYRASELLDLDCQLPVYPCVREAVAAGPLPRSDAPGWSCDTDRSAVTRAAGLTGLTRASLLHIVRWQERLEQLRRRGGLASRPALAAAWGTVACLIDLHISAEDEICGPAVYGIGPEGLVLLRSVKDAHDDIRELIGETSLQPPGSPLWWNLADATWSAWTRRCRDEEHALTAGYQGRVEPALRQRLGHQWRAFREAYIRDLYPHVPQHLPTCQLRLARPAVPRLADTAFAPLACTCRACTRGLDRIPIPG